MIPKMAIALTVTIVTMVSFLMTPALAHSDNFFRICRFDPPTSQYDGKEYYGQEPHTVWMRACASSNCQPIVELDEGLKLTVMTPHTSRGWRPVKVYSIHGGSYYGGQTGWVPARYLCPWNHN